MLGSVVTVALKVRMQPALRSIWHHNLNTSPGCNTLQRRWRATGEDKARGKIEAGRKGRIYRGRERLRVMEVGWGDEASMSLG